MAKKAKKPQTELEKAVGKTRLAAVLAFISTAMNLILMALTFAETDALGMTGGEPMVYLIMAILTGGVGIGLLFKSRVCAILLFTIFCADKILSIVIDPASINITSIAVSVVIWGFAYWGGIAGAFKYHQLKNQPPEPVPVAEPASETV